MVIRQGPRKQVRRLGIAGPWRHLQAAQETDHLGERIAKLRDDKRAFGTAANQAQRAADYLRALQMHAGADRPEVADAA
jgi:antirestriction protein ArdC